MYENDVLKGLIKMDTLKFNHGNVKMIAHRGVSGLECENSIAAFIAAGNRSYVGIETDVHVTKDGKFLIIHDDNTERVTGVNMSVEKSDAEMLLSNKLKNLTYNKCETRSDLFIPSLDEYIKICIHYEKTAVLELKNPMSENAINGICNIIEDLNYLENTIFISFSWENLIVIKNRYPEQSVQFLTEYWDDKMLEKLCLKGIDLDIFYTAVTRDLVKRLHEKNIKINCWTCDTVEEAEKLKEYGVDYITSNILE